MKKKLIMMFLMPMLAISGAKSDFIKANELLINNNVKEAMIVLKKIKYSEKERQEYIDAKNSLVNIMSANGISVEEQVAVIEDALVNVGRNSGKLYAQKAIIYYSLGKANEYENLVNVVNSIDDNILKNEFNYTLALNFAIWDLKEEATKYFMNVILSNNKYLKAESYLVLGQTYYGIKLEDSDGYISQAIRIAEKKEEIYKKLIVFYRSVGDNKRALKYAKEIKLDSIENISDLMSLYFINGYISQGEELVKLLIEKYNLSYYEIAILLNDNRAYIKAEQYIKLEESNDKLNLLAIIQANQGKIEEAKSTAKKAVDLNIPGSKKILDELKSLKH